MKLTTSISATFLFLSLVKLKSSKLIFLLVSGSHCTLCSGNYRQVSYSSSAPLIPELKHP